MNENILFGGKEYGKGAKGYLTDIFPSSENISDEKYFTKNLIDLVESGQDKSSNYKFNDAIKEKYQLIYISQENLSKGDVEHKTFLNNENEISEFTTKLENFLIKVYDKSDYYLNEKKQILNLINDGIIDDFINDSSGNYLLGLRKEKKKGKYIYGLFKRKCKITLDKFVLISCKPKLQKESKIIMYSLRITMFIY